MGILILGPKALDEHFYSSPKCFGETTFAVGLEEWLFVSPSHLLLEEGEEGSLPQGPCYS